MKKTAKIGMTLVAVLALPVVLTTEWMTHKDVAAGTKTNVINNKTNVIKPSTVIKVSDTATQNAPPVENVANEMKMYASF